MTRQQAKQKVWRQVAASLKNAIEGDVPWLSYSKAPECLPLSKKDEARVKEAALEILSELESRAAEL
jgi:hypothetical protein